MNKKKLIPTIVILFSFCFLVSSMTSVKAMNPYWTMQVLMPNAVFSSQTISDSEQMVLIINRDVAFLYVSFLNESTSGAPATDAFAFIYPLSKIVDMLEWVLGGFGYAININNMRIAAQFNPYFEMYNDSLLVDDDVLTIVRNSTINSTEATHLLIPYQYEHAYFNNLTPTTAYPTFADVKPSNYTWGVSFENVSIGVFNATFNAAGAHDGTWMANDSLAWINYTYSYNYDSSNLQWQLNRSIALGAYNDVSEEGLYINKSIATVHTHAMSKVSVSTSPTIENNASVEYNTTLTLPSSYLDFSISSENMGRWDMTETKPEYTVDSVEYNATSCSSPTAAVSVSLNVSNEYFYQGNINVNITGISATSRICYNTWNGTVLVHDPVYFLPLLYPEVPLWYAFLPDLIVDTSTETLLWIVLIVLGAILIFVIADQGGSKAKKKVSERRERTKAKDDELKHMKQELERKDAQLKKERALKRKYYKKAKGK